MTCMACASLLLSPSLCPQASQDQQLDCALDLMRRLPPQQIEKNLSDLIDLVCHTHTHRHTNTFVCVCVYSTYMYLQYFTE